MGCPIPECVRVRVRLGLPQVYDDNGGRVAGRGRGSGVYINLNFSARRQSRIIFIPSYSRRIFVGDGRGRDVQ